MAVALDSRVPGDAAEDCVDIVELHSTVKGEEEPVVMNTMR